MSNNFAADCLASLGFKGSPYPDVLPISYASLHRMFKDIGERMAQLENAAEQNALRRDHVTEVRADAAQAFREAATEALGRIDIERIARLVADLTSLTPEERAERVKTRLISEAITTSKSRKATTNA